MQYCVKRSSVQVCGSALPPGNLGVTNESIGKADSNVISASAVAPVLTRDAPFIYTPFNAQTFVHNNDSSPTPSSCAKSCSMLLGIRCAARRCSWQIQYSHPKQTCAWNLSSAKVSTLPIASSNGVIRWPSPDDSRLNGVDCWRFEACVIACSVSATKPRPKVYC